VHLISVVIRVPGFTRNQCLRRYGAVVLPGAIQMLLQASRVEFIVRAGIRESDLFRWMWSDCAWRHLDQRRRPAVH